VTLSTARNTAALGIDVGGSSLKVARVDTATQTLLSPFTSVPTPQPATPAALVQLFAQLSQQLAPADPVGIAMPCVVQHGITRSAANIDPGWIDFDCAAAARSALGRRVTVLNDADAAGLAEMRWGAGRGVRGTVMLLTFGTGIGSALFNDGRLLPNTELGHLQVDGREAEHQASARVRTVESLDWAAWAARVNRVLAEYHALFWPDLFILGGSISQDFAQFEHLLRCRAPVRAAQFTAQAGAMGAALAAAEDQ
jgi:polyphosphate glucokinase